MSGIFFALKILDSLAILLFVELRVVNGKRNTHRMRTHCLSSFIWDRDFIFRS